MSEIDWNATLFGMSVLELVAAGLGLVSVWLTVRQNVWCWPTGAVMVALYFYIFYESKLYADMGLQAVYFVLQFYGWYQWLHGGEKRQELPVSRTPRRLLFLLAALGALGTVGLGWVLRTYTDAAIPYWDSTATAFSLVAQWMLARKFLENWLFWIGVDVLSVGIYVYKELYPTAVLYAIFLVMAATGFVQWKKTLPGWKPA
jgi:nicotinamide mononucleotide transporter